MIGPDPWEGLLVMRQFLAESGRYLAEGAGVRAANRLRNQEPVVMAHFREV
jgi:hypothetical protein